MLSSSVVDPKAYPVLIVDDEPDIVDTLRLSYEDDFSIHGTTSGAEALQILADQPIAVLVTDQRMPEMQGVDLIRRALEIRDDIVPIILTGYTDVESLVKAINLGRIYRYVPKPWDRRDLRTTISQAIELYHLEHENDRLGLDNARLVTELQRANEVLAQENTYYKRREAIDGGFASIVGTSPAAARLIDMARRVADAPTTILIEGETGTGKELLAKALHTESARRQKLFVAINTGAVPESLLQSELFGHRKGAFTGAMSDKKGLFEIADGGTIFLDEIGETTPAMQIHLLRALQEREIQPVGANRPVKIDVRIVAATNRDLEQEVAAGRFREDLLFRLRVVRLRMPALRDRLDDVPALADHFLQQHTVRLRKPVSGFAPEAIEALMAHSYRGNIRELGNMIERAVLLCDPGGPIVESDLFEHPIDDAVPPAEAEAEGDQLLGTVARFEQDRIRDMLSQCGGNKTHAANRLGITYRGLLKKMQRHGMMPSPGK